MLTAEWANVGVVFLVAICTVVANLAITHFSVQSLTKGQEAIQQTCSETGKAVSRLDMAAAVNVAHQADTARRLSDMEKQQSTQAEQIRVLRTQIHMVNGKMMEVDPKWKPYQKEDM